MSRVTSRRPASSSPNWNTRQRPSHAPAMRGENAEENGDTGEAILPQDVLATFETINVAGEQARKV